ncbi:glycosyltransferase [Gemmatimonas sp.]|uniref:glycosyltransferase n=1 Tax=Gemmatimonas sp. TaxID=1962908 RepID=UPI003982F334
MSATLTGHPAARRESIASCPLRVTMLLGGLGVGGAETQAIALAAALQHDGHTVTLATLADGPLRSVVESHGLAMHVLPRVAGLAASAVPALARYLATSRPQVVYAFLEVQWLLALTAVSSMRAAYRPRVVLGLRTSGYDARPASIKERVVRTLVKYATPRADLLIANSGSGLDSYRALAPNAPAGVVVHNGIDVARFEPSASLRASWRRKWSLPADAVIVGHVGRLHPVKDHELLLRACSRASADTRAFHLVCVGHPEPTKVATLERLADMLGIASRVHFVGGLAEAHTVYPAFDVLALSSRSEGFPNVVAEAMACGVPAVVTASGASADIVGAFGEVAPVGDVDAFADALVRILARASSTLTHDVRAHIVSNFSLDAAAARTAAALQTLFRVNTV